ncbi:golgin subfamily A member 3-like [Acanthaster planci]|uniref:Golgin subfamily A member 3-like n=1 Tax=Acanthaster planci TaxID=133434 RepID=A0A8B7YUD0_ACAPL|nr:golgin subfamily A member 3-like [Acanthaster planci]XP_022096312.1 golgin subfamily A member 3-like [Acanthaster planci]
MDESDAYALSAANQRRVRPRGNPGGSFDVLVAYDSDIYVPESVTDQSNRSEETLRELAGLSQISPSSANTARQDYQEVSLVQGREVSHIREVPVRDVDSDIGIRENPPLSRVQVPLETQHQFDLFSSTSLPPSPDRLTSSVRPNAPQHLNSSEPLVQGDRNSARYLRILVPQQDTSSQPLFSPDFHHTQPSYSRNTSHNFSETELFDSLPSTAENLLLESPSDSPAHFSQLRLALNSLESDGETFLSLDDSISEPQPSLTSGSSKLPSRQQSRQQKLPSQGKTSEKSQFSESGLEQELKRLVVQIYSEKATEFVPIAGLSLGHLSASTVSKDKQSHTMDDSHATLVDYQDDVLSSGAMSSGTLPDIPHGEMGDNTGRSQPFLSGGQPQQPSGVSLGDLSNLSSTADALALQRSVIGKSPTKPASMEEIAAAIAAAEKQYRQRLQHYKQQQQSAPPNQSPEQLHNGSPAFNRENLDEMPTRLPATPPKQASDTEDNLNHTDSSTGPTNTTSEALAKTKPVPTTTRVRPGSLIGQNTGLAVSSAVGTKFGIPPSSMDHSPSPIETANKERILFRSPVQAITTTRGGRTVSVHKPSHQKGDGKTSRNTSKKVDNQVYASPAEMKASIASKSSDPPAETKPGKPTQSFVAVMAAEDRFEVQEIGIEPNSEVIVTRDLQSVGKRHLSGEDLQTAASHLQPEIAQQYPEARSDQMTKEDQPKQSFLGSFFQWGKKQDPEPQPQHSLSLPGVSQPSSPPPAAVAASNATDHTINTKSPRAGLGQQAAAESQDSGIDLVPVPSSVGEVFHAEFEPVHSSTPVKHRLGSNGPVARKEVASPDVANQALQSNEVDSDEETDSRIQASRLRPVREPPIQHQPLVTKDSPQQPSKPLVTRSNHVGNSTPGASVRRRDLHKMPTTSLTSVYGSLKTSSPHYSATPIDHADLQSVLREKANLEGRLETLAAETESALQQRAEMQTQVASLQAQLKANASAADTAQQQLSAMDSDMAAAMQNQAQLEQALSALQTSLDSKEEDLEALQRELQASEVTSQRLNARMEEFREAMDTKEATIATLKDKIAAVQKEAEKAHQERTQHLAELKTLQGDVESLTSAKEWFQEQLQTAQEMRGKLQKDLTETQNEAKKHGAAVETLKAEKAQLMHQLSETRQQALKEKELIAQHLETIEADFLAREAAFQDLQKEKVAVQEAVASKMDQMNEERLKLSNLIASCVELERQLDRTQKELADKQADVSNLEAEKKEMVKKLALVQESLLARDKELEALQEKCIDAELKVKELQNSALEQEGSLQSYRAEKAALEAALATANQEKRAFDEALQNLRQDMGKVEQGFHQMKQDLGKKDTQMESLLRDKEDLQMQLRDAEEQLQHHQRSMSTFQEDMSSKEDLLNELNRVKDAMEDEVALLRQLLEASKKSNQESQAVSAGLQDELAHSRGELKDLEAQLESAMTENAHLEGQLEMMADEQQRFSNLLDENARLKQKLAETQSTTHRELADERAKALRLGSDLAATQKELKEKQRVYESAASTLTKKLKEAMDAKQAAEADIEALRRDEVASNIEIQNRLTAQLETTRKDLSDAQQERDDLMRQLEELKQQMEEETTAYKEKMADLENQLQALKELCEQQQRNEEANRRMALDLERERGRLAGVQQSHSALKQHANLLEAALGRRETTLAEMAAQMTTNSQDCAAELDRLRAKLRDETQALRKEKEANKGLQKQVAHGKAEIGRLQCDIQDQGTVLEETRMLQDKQADKLQTLREELNKSIQHEEEQKAKTEEVRGQLEEAKGQLGQLKRQLLEKHSRDPVVAEQIKALEWESEQRGREAQAVKEQLELAEHRQKIEMDNAQATIQMGRKELEALKAELAATRKEKFAYQGKLSQFKSALKATLQQNKLLKAKLRSRQKDRNTAASPKMAAGPVASSDVTMVPDDIIVPEISVDVEALLSSDDKDGITAASSKPLAALRGCLQSVKDQMGGLQQQMDKHTSAVNSSSKAWKDVESKVRDLRKSCMTPLDGSSTPPSKTSRRSSPAAPPDTPLATPKMPQATPANNLPRPTPASMTFPSLPNVHDI